MRFKLLLGCAAALSVALVSTAHAAIVVGTTPVASPIAATGFETLTFLPGNTPYVDGGVSVEYVSPLGEFVASGIPYALSNPNGVGSWGMIQNHGYTDATLVGGGTFNAFSGFFGSEWTSGPLTVEFLLGGTSVGTVNLSGLTTIGQTVSFSNFTADEVRFASAFGGADELGVDDLAFGGAAGGVPEPASWALLILGFFGLGSLLRRTQTSLAAS